MNPTIERLDVDDQDQVRDYETGFYNSFERLSNPGIRELWVWDDEGKRLRSKIPYSAQEIYFVRDAQGKIGSAIAFNLSDQHFQSSAYNFARPAEHPTFEIVTLFASSGNTLNKLHMLERARRDFIGSYPYCYATCGERVLPLHVRIGAEVLDKSTVNGQLRYFIRYDLQQPFIRQQ